MLWQSLKNLWTKRPPKPCGHGLLVFDTYRDTRLVTCQECGEVWLSDLPGPEWTPEPRLDPEGAPWGI